MDRPVEVTTEETEVPKTVAQAPSPGKERSDRALFARNNKAELRAQAATMWVDAEEASAGRGAHLAPTKNSIAQALGFVGAGRYMPAFLAEPEFSRALEFERIRRVAQGATRMTKHEISVLASMISRAGMIEAARRFVMTPEKISTRDLLSETRSYARLAADVDAETGSDGRSVSNTINVFLTAARRLPPKARERYLGIFDDSMGRLSLAAGEAREKASGHG